MSKIIPYVYDQGNKQWSIPDTLMAQLFIKMQDLGLAETVFANGTVKNHLQWLMFVQHKSNVVNIVGNEKEVEGITWLNSFGYNYAFGHFCFFPQTWGKNSVELGKMVLNYWFNDLKSGDWGLDVIMGQVPATNERAVEYTKKIGMIPMGIVPGIKYQKDSDASGAFFCWISSEVYCYLAV